MGVVENLLTACRFFDRELAGYVADDDLEEIAYMVSDSLSSECRCKSPCMPAGAHYSPRPPCLEAAGMQC